MAAVSLNSEPNRQLIRLRSLEWKVGKSSLSYKKEKKKAYIKGSAQPPAQTTSVTYLQYISDAPQTLK